MTPQHPSDEAVKSFLACFAMDGCVVISLTFSHRLYLFCCVFSDVGRVEGGLKIRRCGKQINRV